jgi:O-antigen/teichoic acid export membrane protein
VDELRVSPTVCPRCKTELQVFLKANWVYTVVSLTIGVVVAYLQGHESIILGIWALFYGMVILLVIKIYRWELHLPIKVVEKPDYRLFPTHNC